jgi:hypothetical protein
LARLLADIDLLFGFLGVVRRPVRVEAIFLTVREGPVRRLILGAVGEHDQLRAVGGVVFDDGDFEQRLGGGLIAHEKRDLTAAPRQARRDGVAPAPERPDLLDHVLAQIRGPVVGEGNHALLQHEREERHAEPHEQKRRDRTHEPDAAGFHGRQFALAREPLEREQHAEQHGHRHDRDQDLRQLPQEVFDRGSERRVFFGHEPADGKDVRGGEDQREGRKPERDRPAQFRNHVAVEDRRQRGETRCPRERPRLPWARLQSRNLSPR